MEGQEGEEEREEGCCPLGLALWSGTPVAAGKVDTSTLWWLLL